MSARLRVKCSITQLDFERRALRARLAFASGNHVDAERLMRQIEDCELSLAATPAGTIADLAIKYGLLFEALAFDQRDAAITLEGILLAALKNDVARLVIKECDDGG